MKKAILLLAITSITFTSFSQNKQSANLPIETKKEQPDTTLTNQTPLISIDDYSEFSALIGKRLTGDDCDMIRGWWIERLKVRIAERKQKKK